MTGWDKFITAITLIWPVVFTLIFIGVTIYAYRYGLTAEWWLGYWHWWTWFAFVVAAIVTIWFIIGGFRDLRRMFKRLEAYVPDEDDDGRVT
jgi:SSS family solute:Na+ symporter